MGVRLLQLGRTSISWLNSTSTCSASCLCSCHRANHAAMWLSALRSSRVPFQITRLRSVVPSTSTTIHDADVFSNSLRKTLDAHRSSNRARLIRKVYPRKPPAGLWRPEFPRENYANYKPDAPPAPTVEEQELELKDSSSRRRRRLLLRNREEAATAAATRSTQSQLEKNLIQSSDSLNGFGDRPWLSHLAPSDTAIDNASTLLNAEILALERYLTPSLQEQNWIDQLSAQVTCLLKPVVPHTPQLIGSRQIGLALAHSDLNFFLPFEDLPRAPDRIRKPSATRPQIQDAHLRLLRKVQSTLESSPLFDRVSISGKRRSILEAHHQATGLRLRFYCGERTPLIMDCLKDYLVQYPTLHPLYIAARTLLEARGLFGSAQTGIRPDALAILIVAFLKLNTSQSSVSSDIGKQFLAFLQFYGSEVDLQSAGIAVDPAGIFGSEKTQESESDQEHTEPAYRRGQRSLINAKRTAVSRGNIPAGQRLCIQDPTHYMNDLGRSCTRTAELQNVFLTAHQQLCDASTAWDDTHKADSILAAGLRANFDQLNLLREKLVPRDTPVH